MSINLNYITIQRFFIKANKVTKFVYVFFLFNTCLGQSLKHVYRYEYNTQFAGIKKQFCLYYSIDSVPSFRSDSLSFYRFTFSTDSLEKSGFISFKNKNGDIFYISDTNKEKPTKTQMIFTRSKHFIKGIKKFPFIERDVDLFYQIKANTTFFKVKYKYPLDSHSIYISEFKFNKNENYPSAIVLYFPFEDNKIVTIHPSNVP